MGVWYELVNQTKKEIITFSHLPAKKARELAGHPATAALTTWYLLQNSGDAIAFISDTNGEWPFATGSRAELKHYRDVTDRVITELVTEGILRDDGLEWADEVEPETCYIRAIRNVWMEGSTNREGKE